MRGGSPNPYSPSSGRVERGLAEPLRLSSGEVQSGSLALAVLQRRFERGLGPSNQTLSPSRGEGRVRGGKRRNVHFATRKRGLEQSRGGWRMRNARVVIHDPDSL
jgi:hypothetical protein